MPELPDVEVYKRYVDATSLHQRIDHVDTGEARLFQDTGRRSLAGALEGASLQSTRRHGKYLFISYGESSLMLHFGMTGFLHYFKDAGSSDSTGGSDKHSSHEQLVIYFDNGYCLAYDNQRLLGQIDLVEDESAYIEAHDLGPDALRISEDAFADSFSGRGSVKSRFMNQGIIAGIGNVYSDEICFQAGIDPRRRLADLSDEDRHNLYRTMHRVMDVVVEHGAEPQKLPSGYLTPRREDGAECPRCGGRVKKVTISGRSSYICTSCQK